MIELLVFYSQPFLGKGFPFFLSGIVFTAFYRKTFGRGKPVPVGMLATLYAFAIPTLFYMDVIRAIPSPSIGHAGWVWNLLLLFWCWALATSATLYFRVLTENTAAFPEEKSVILRLWLLVLLLALALLLTLARYGHLLLMEEMWLLFAVPPQLPTI